MFSYIYWNPKKEFFILPIIDYPIVWYSVLFLFGFILGYYIFINILRRYFFYFPKITNNDVISFDRLKIDLINPRNDKQKKIAKFFFKKNIDSEFEILKLLNNFINGKIENRRFLEKAFSLSILSIKKKIVKITDKLSVYVILATVIGARLGHLFFYEKPQSYLNNPLNIIKTWQGGLASHGAAIALLIALFVFCRDLKKVKPKLSYIHLLDFICIPIAFAGFCIRIGNFINQEIIGIETSVFWAVIFANPIEEALVVPRHPVQLYEAIFYLLVFFMLFYFSYKRKFLLKEGRLLSFFLTLVFTFRFFIEFLKVRESHILSNDSVLLMGQYLSIPFIIIGVIFLFWDKIKTFFLKNNEIID
jgi:prolipoprotein diacylglyceryl transferase